MNHKQHEMLGINERTEYVKFAGVLILITAVAWLHADWRGLDLMQYLESFMGVFFVVFAGFKLYNLKEFAYGFQSYEILKDRSVNWGYAYPFIQLLFGGLYLFGFGSHFVDALVFFWSASGAYIVWQTLRKKGDIHCVCLGNVIKLPLSRISFFEDFGMALMAAAMYILR